MQLPTDLRARSLPENVPASRWALVPVPAEARTWSFASHPLHTDITAWLTSWTDVPVPHPCGVFVWGETGTGKTGLAIASLRVCAERGDGDVGLWNIMTLTRSAGRDPVDRPPPVYFSTWRNLVLRVRSDRWGEESFLDTLDQRVAVLAIDDLDVGGMSPWKEEVLLHLLQRPANGRRLILTGNVPPHHLATRFGERCADRLLDPSLFALVPVHGRSWRRRDR